ncbi:hypothetical protein MVES_000865 [Malassezia vespertilionis]|uniref:Structural maintenance of chromosomes protein n=1 Tax=Malassezia vespertilionis TaxID=2020962 RepID=A0A2N1JE27_9BASI|nr:hypothetical protein MVES_000865 [Malassezia vespertilionis]
MVVERRAPSGRMRTRSGTHEVAEDATRAEAQVSPSLERRAPATPAQPKQNRMITTPHHRMQNPFTTPARTGMPLVTPARTAQRTFGSPVAPPVPQKRLVIHKLVLQDFKSYAGRQEIGPFHKSFSSVVGPNGSGKSNVIDSLLFVFGWRANKMRQGKLSELIYNRQGAAPPQHCTVEVWFREIIDVPGSEEFTVVPNSRLIVARSASRNNTSQYTIDGKRSNFTQVTTLLRERGIDLDHKRFLILQGEVESIAQMPPKARTEHDEGLLEYLEDIIGTSDYKQPIAEHANAVDAANETRGEKMHRLKIVQRELDHLEPKRKQAEQYLRDHNELMRNQSRLWQRYMWEARAGLAKVSEESEMLAAQLSQEAEKHSEAQLQSQSVRDQFEAVAAEGSALEKQVHTLRKELGRHEKHDVELKAREKLLQGKRKKLTTALSDGKSNVSEARAEAQNADSEIERIHEEIAAHEAALEHEQSALERMCDDLESKTRVFNLQIQEKQQQLAPWAAKIREHNAARDVAMQERALLLEHEQEVQQRHTEAKAHVQDLHAALQEKHDEVAALESEKVGTADKAADDADMLEKMRSEEHTLRTKAAMARRTAEEAADAVAASKSHGEMLSNLTRQAELGFLSGLHGRLGSLGTIDARYDKAVSTACRALNDILVESVESGQECIEYLRKHNLGRARFLLLQSVKVDSKAMAPLATPENVPRLFDLIVPKDARYASAFYSELGDTLVARDLQQASRIAYGKRRWRVVTEDGQLIDKSGTMSGGGAKPKQGLMSSTLISDVSAEHAATLRKEAQAADAALQSHVKSLAHFSAIYERSTSRGPDIDHRLAMLAMDIRTNEQRIRQARQRVEEAEKECRENTGDAQRFQALDAQVEEHTSATASLHTTTQSIEAEIQALQEHILQVGGVELRTLQSKVEGVRGMLALANERLANVELSKAKAENEMKRYETSKHDNAAQLAALDTEIAELEDKQRAQSSAMDVLRTQVDELRYELEEKSARKKELKGVLEEHAEKLGAFCKFELEVKQQLEACEQRKTESEQQLASWSEKHAQLALHDANLAVDMRQAKSEPDVELDDVSLPPLSDAELETMDKQALLSTIEVMEKRMEENESNLDVLDEYRTTEEVFLSRAKELEDTTAVRDGAQQKFDALRKERLQRFMQGFSQISLKLKEMYQTITLGGNAELELVDSLDPFSEGILFSVMPPKKSWKNISNLSGGEKTLSSLALVFALHAYKPTPLYVMDEIDAALDFRNVSIIANIIKERTRGAQFIIISLRNNMFELSARLVGTCTARLRRRRAPANYRLLR